MLRWKKQLCFLGMTAVLLYGMILYGRRQKAETDAETNTVMSKESERETEPEGEKEQETEEQEAKKIALTFDDGPSAECTDKVLDVLEEKDVKATFFLIGEYVEKYPEVARRIVGEGHTIGIHCYRHDYGVLYASKESFLEDFQKAYDVIYQVTGVETRLFRFPGGSMNDYNKDVYQEIIEAMTEQGYIYYDWNASLEDAVGKREQQTLIRNAVTSAQGRKRVVMLAHDVVRQTALCLDELLEQFPEYQMRPLLEESEPVQF